MPLGCVQRVTSPLFPPPQPLFRHRRLRPVRPPRREQHRRRCGAERIGVLDGLYREGVAALGGFAVCDGVWVEDREAVLRRWEQRRGDARIKAEAKGRGGDAGVGIGKVFSCGSMRAVVGRRKGPTHLPIANSSSGNRRGRRDAGGGEKRIAAVEHHRPSALTAASTTIMTIGSSPTDPNITTTTYARVVAEGRRKRRRIESAPQQPRIDEAIDVAREEHVSCEACRGEP